MLKQNRYFVESSHADVLQILLKDPVVQECRRRREEGADQDQLEESSVAKSTNPTGGSGSGFGKKATTDRNGTDSADAGNAVPTDITDFYSKLDAEDDDEVEEKVVSFEVNQEKIEVIQRRCIQMEYPLLAEYDFKNDTRNPDIK